MGKLSALRFFKDQWTNLELATADLTGKTVIVTGANVGLGMEAAKHFARMKPGKLILACRDIKGAEEVVKQIREESKLGDEVVAWHIDLAFFASVIAFADKFKKEGGGRLDLLVENAAIVMHDFKKTEDGWERTIQVNYLATALLAILLLPVQLKTEPSGKTPRLVIVGSDAHHLIKPKDGTDPKLLEKLSDEKYKSPSAPMSQRYNISKLMSICLTRSLVAHLPAPSPLTVVSVNPGLCHSSLARNAKGVEIPLLKLFKGLCARTSEMGSRTLVWGALGGDYEVVHGHYLDSCRVREESDWSLGKDGLAMQDNIWQQTIEILKGVSPEVESIVAEHLTPK